MLDYAPDGMLDGFTAARGQELTAVWEGEGVPDVNLLSRLIAASRAATSSSVNASRPAKQISFHPEQIAGFCAS